MISQETYATGLIRPKTTALFFDRLWIPDVLDNVNTDYALPFLSVPPEIRMKNPQHSLEWLLSFSMNLAEHKSIEDKELLDFSYFLQHLVKALSVENRSLKELKSSFSNVLKFRSDRKQQFDFVSYISRLDYLSKLQVFAHEEEHTLYEKLRENYVPHFYQNVAINYIVKEYVKEGIALTPIYLSPEQVIDYSELYKQILGNNPEYSKTKSILKLLPNSGGGNTQVLNNLFGLETGLSICLDLIPDIVEDKLSWAQVLDVRKDKKAQDKLRRLRRWFALELLEKSPDEVSVIIEKQLDEYKWALKKHGIETTLGGFTTIITFVSGPALMNLISTSPLAAISGGIAIGAGAIAWISKKVIEKTEIDRSEVAFIYDVNKLLT